MRVLVACPADPCYGLCVMWAAAQPPGRFGPSLHATQILRPGWLCGQRQNAWIVRKDSMNLGPITL